MRASSSNVQETTRYNDNKENHPSLRSNVNRYVSSYDQASVEYSDGLQETVPKLWTQFGDREAMPNEMLPHAMTALDYSFKVSILFEAHACTSHCGKVSIIFQPEKDRIL